MGELVRAAEAALCDAVGMRVFGTHEADTIAQLERCAAVEPGTPAVLCADGHLGYSMPIGGVVAYRHHVSPSGVGYDIACGNLAVRTNIAARDLADEEMRRVADEIRRRISFGIGRKNRKPVRDHPVFDRIAGSAIAAQGALIDLAREQLGTVGAGNHYVDVLEDESGRLWVAVHFGSRGFGFKTANGFMNIARGRKFGAGHGEGAMNAPPLLLPVDGESGQDYVEAMTIAGEYAYAGRGVVADSVLQILGATATDSVHNHHNFAWRERHGEADYIVIPQGRNAGIPRTTRLHWRQHGRHLGDRPRHGDDGWRGGALFNRHGAGRVMSRTKAAENTGRCAGTGSV